MRTTVAELDERFADDPLVSHSGQFPLGRPVSERCSAEMPSETGVRPWNLRGMRTCPTTTGLSRVGVYDHVSQCSRDEAGRLLWKAADDGGATAKSKTDNDGDEGRSEDWEYDFAPDHPVPL